MLQTPVDTFCKLAVVEKPSFVVGIVVISVNTVGDISTSGLGGHIAISRCLSSSMSHLSVDTFFEFGVVEDFVYRTRITVIGY